MRDKPKSQEPYDIDICITIPLYTKTYKKYSLLTIYCAQYILKNIDATNKQIYLKGNHVNSYLNSLMFGT